MQPGEWNPDKWDLINYGGDDAQAIAAFEAACTPPEGWWRKFWWKITKGYDVFSLLAFVGPSVQVSWMHYCFELCYRMKTGRKPTARITAEILLLEITKVPTTASQLYNRKGRYNAEFSIITNA
jgi:hypothetical protein